MNYESKTKRQQEVMEDILRQLRAFLRKKIAVKV